jgi:hypothetical protein
MSKSVRRIVSKVAPIALPIIAPGIGTALGAGLGLTGAAASTVGGGLLGAGLGAVGGGGLKGALLGGATGGLAGGLTSGANIPGFGSFGGSLGAGGMGPPTPGTGLLGSVSNATSGIGSALRNAVGLTGSGSGGGLGGLGNIASGINAYMTQDDMEEELMKAQGRARDVVNPFLQTGTGANQQLSDRLTSGFNPGDLTQDPGYQFRLREGQSALERSLAARGLGQSGAALKAAQEFGQGLADQTYNDAYSRWLQQNSQLSGLGGQGLSAAGAVGDIYGNMGNIGANATLAKNNVVTGTLASALRGGGSQIIGYDASGNPIYAQ